MKKETYFCDVCEKQVPAKLEEKKIQVIFHTEQTEGRGVKPYLSDQKIEICDDCYGKILKGNYLHGTGAMGYNKYGFRDAKK